MPDGKISGYATNRKLLSNRVKFALSTPPMSYPEFLRTLSVLFNSTIRPS